MPQPPSGGAGRAAFADLVADDGSVVQRSVFSSPEVYRAELDAIFARSWLYIGHESQVARPGQFITTSMGPDSIILARTAAGELRASLNQCTHRGVQVCRADRGEAEVFRCPNHGWSFGLDGSLVDRPFADRGYDPNDRASRNLLPARVSTYRGLVFATFDHDAAPLIDHLGDIAYYLDLFLDRGAAGTEVLGGVHRWIVRCNWKILPENLAADLYHAPTAHISHSLVTGAETASYLDEAWQIATGAGHSTCVRFRAPEEQVQQSLDPVLPDPAHRDALERYLERSSEEAADRLGEVRANMHAFTGSVFPNFSFVPSLFSIRVARPIDATTTEISSWCLVPADCPPEVKGAMGRISAMSLGPGGLVEQEDVLNFVEMTSAAQTVVDPRPFQVGMGLDAEIRDLGIPGRATGPWTEHNMRSYWQQWKRQMGAS